MVNIESIEDWVGSQAKSEAGKSVGARLLYAAEKTFWLEGPLRHAHDILDMVRWNNE